ncbi:hypothetical protein, partial [Alcaligenes faecalis]
QVAGLDNNSAFFCPFSFFFCPCGAHHVPHRPGAFIFFGGCTMTKLSLKEGFCIYFAQVKFDRTIYSFGSGLGYTSTIYPYVVANSTDKAEQLIRAKYDSPESRVVRIDLSLARNQNINSYIATETFLGLNKAIE